MTPNVRVRIAPSPTGIPHIGNTRTALFNYLFAKHHGGTFILRIEDTDRTRLVSGSEEALYEILKWLGLFWDEKYTQSERLDIYKEHAQTLKEKDLAYEDNGAIRFRMPKDETTDWTDAIGNKKISFQNKDQEDFVILKSDGFPTYNFANVIDDHLMNITHVIRGDEFISSVPKHLQLYKSFSWEPPILAHLPVILGSDKTKLSKRHGAKSALDYKKEGFLKEAVLNFMVLLGWNPGGDKEILSLSEMIELFDLSGVNSASPIFDQKKLAWMNGVYIRKSQISSPVGGLKSQIVAYDEKLKNVDEVLLDKVIPLAQTRIDTLADFYPLVQHFFEEPKIGMEEKERAIARKLNTAFLKIEQWKKDIILAALKNVMQEENVRMPILYTVLTGKPSGLPLPESLEILGKETVLKRLSNLRT